MHPLGIELVHPKTGVVVWRNILPGSQEEAVHRGAGYITADEFQQNQRAEKRKAARLEKAEKISSDV